MQGKKEDEILNRLRETFRIEAGEHLQAMSSGLLELERGVDPERSSHLVEEIFRHVHSLKGAARAVNLTAIESVCQSLEGIFAGWKRGEAGPHPDQFDLLHHALNKIEGLVSSSLSDDKPEPEVKTEQPVRAAEPTVPDGAQTVRIATSKLDLLLLEAEEMLAVKLNLARNAASLRDLQRDVEGWRQKWESVSQHVSDLRRLEGQSEILAFLDWNLDRMRSIEEKLRSSAATAVQDQQLVSRRVDELLADSKQLLMMPFSTLLDLFPKIVREMSREQGKEADITIQGGEIEVDKRIIEQMKDPLIHLIRNCIDHGIEKPDVRVNRGKPPRATISLTITRLGPSAIEVRVADDGAGINAERVRIAASKLKGEGSEDEASDLIFRSGLSTSPIITEISGRGLGLAIVRESVERLGGRVSVESTPGAGTTFRMSLPTLLATFRGVLVRAADRFFLLPTASVERVARVEAANVKTVENRETITLDGKAVALVWLDTVLELPRTTDGGTSAWLSVAVLSSRGERIAFAVDEVLHEEEVLVKTLVKPLSRVRHISGATTLGSSKVIPVLDVPELMETAKHAAVGPRKAITAARKAEKRSRILVAEDSITSRMLLKTILESAGHDVVTAVDGMDALTELRSGSFDLVISDVEMPRMNGFELTTQIRSDKKLSDKPVILVTALSSREDRERGIEVGANAYIIKSSFDQSNLLEAVDRLA